MTTSYSPVITLSGEAKIAASVGPDHTPINFSQLAMGDGTGPWLETSVALSHEVWRGIITAVTRDPSNPTQVIVTASIPGEAGPFYMREAAVYTDDGQMFVSGAYPETFKPVPSSGAVMDLEVDYVFVVTQSAVVSVVISTVDANDIASWLRVPFMAVDGFQAAPPVSADPGATYVVNGAPTGLWAGQGWKLAQMNATGWVFKDAPLETLVRLQDGSFLQRVDPGANAGNAWIVWVPPLQAHHHPISDIDGLQTALEGKSPVGHTHSQYLRKDISDSSAGVIGATGFTTPGNSGVGGTLTAAGVSAGVLAVSGASSLGNTTVNGPLGVTGSVAAGGFSTSGTASANFGSFGSATVSGTLTANVLNVNGQANFAANMHVSGSVGIDGGLSVANNVRSGNALYVDGPFSSIVAYDRNGAGKSTGLYRLNGTGFIFDSDYGNVIAIGGGVTNVIGALQRNAINVVTEDRFFQAGAGILMDGAVNGVGAFSGNHNISVDLGWLEGILTPAGRVVAMGVGSVLTGQSGALGCSFSVTGGGGTSPYSLNVTFNSALPNASYLVAPYTLLASKANWGFSVSIPNPGPDGGDVGIFFIVLEP